MSVAVTGASEIALALLTTMSSAPKCSAARSIAVLTAASSRTSTASGSARPPAASLSAAAVWMVPASFGCGASVLAAIAMLAPSRAARSAIARPMPREAPVMNRVFPARDMLDPLVIPGRPEGPGPESSGGSPDGFRVRELRSRPGMAPADSFLPRQERLERGARLGGGKAYAEQVGLLLDARDRLVGRAAHEAARRGERLGGQRRDL